MTSLADVRAALAAQIERETGLRAYAGAEATITPPCVVVDLGESVEYHATMDPTSATVRYDVTVLVPVAVTGPALEALDEALSPTGPRSIRAAVETDRTLGGLVSSATCIRAGRIQPYTLGGAEYAGVRLEVEVML